jgi:uncharacterized protein YaaN involved in tellurite resistance
MSTETATQTVSDLKLTPPDPVPTVTASQAMGLVPVTDEQTTKLQERVDAYVADLIAQDVNSPEFGKRVDQLTNMGRKEMMEAANQSNRFLDKPIRRMDESSGVGADLAELRRVVEDLDPSKKGNLMTKQKLFGIIPIISTVTRARRRISARSWAASAMARTSCSWTTPQSTSSGRICGLRWASSNR